MRPQKSHLLPLTGIRFFLALWVVMFHQPFLQGYSWTAQFPEPLPSIFRSGYLAVGVFFMLSGFVLSYNYPLSAPWSVSHFNTFVVARFARIYPAYVVGLLLSAPAVVFHATTFSVVTIGKEILKAVLVWTLLQSWIPQMATAWNHPSWSLSVEAFFYCCFPVIGVALWKLSKPWSILGAAFAIWALSLFGPLIAVNLLLMDNIGIPGGSWTPDTRGPWVDFLKFNPLLQIPQLAMGIVIGRVYTLLCDNNTSLVGRGYWLYIPALLLELVAIDRYGGTYFLFLHNGLLLPLHSLVILGLALGGGTLARLLSVRPVILLGNASYSLYILHIPVSFWMSAIARRVFLFQPEGLLATAFYVVVVVCLSLIVFRMIEEPASRVLKGLRRGSSLVPRSETTFELGSVSAK